MTQKPTIKEVIAAMQNDYKICWSDDTHAIFKAFLADDEPEQKIPLDYLSIPRKTFGLLLEQRC